MANDVNKCMFIGRLGADPETRYTQSGGAITNIRIACGWKTKDKEGTEWVPVVFFNKLAEIVDKYCSKGSQVFVEGSFRTRQWEDKDGNKRYTSEIVATNMQLLGGRQEGSQRPPEQNSRPSRQSPPPSADDFDDVPF